MISVGLPAYNFFIPDRIKRFLKKRNPVVSRDFPPHTRRITRTSESRALHSFRMLFLQKLLIQEPSLLFERSRSSAAIQTMIRTLRVIVPVFLCIHTGLRLFLRQSVPAHDAFQTDLRGSEDGNGGGAESIRAAFKKQGRVNYNSRRPLRKEP